jgi:hypothetical protein
MLSAFPHMLSPEMELSLPTLYPVENLLIHNLRTYGWNGGLWNKQFYIATLLSNKDQQGFLCIRLHKERKIKAWMTFAKETYTVCQSIYTSRSNLKLHPQHLRSLTIYGTYIHTGPISKNIHTKNQTSHDLLKCETWLHIQFAPLYTHEIDEKRWELHWHPTNVHKQWIRKKLSCI